MLGSIVLVLFTNFSSASPGSQKRVKLTTTQYVGLATTMSIGINFLQSMLACCCKIIIIIFADCCPAPLTTVLGTFRRYTGDWPESVQYSLGFLNFFNLDMNLLSVECYVDSSTYRQKYIFKVGNVRCKALLYC